MKQAGWQTGMGIAAVLAWAGNACSQSVDTTMARAVIDQPLSMSVQVRGFDWPASRLSPDCLQVQIQQGESGETITPVRVRTVPSGDDGRALVQISSPQLVTDPVLTGRLSLLCGADYTREFTVLADPPTAVTMRKRPSPPATVKLPAESLPTRAPEPAAPAARHTTRSDDPPAAVEASKVRAMPEAEVQRLVSAVVSALALMPPLDGSTAAPPIQPVVATAEMPWQELREEQRQTRTAVASLLARIERNEHDTRRDALLVIGGILGLSASLLVLRLVREGLLPRMGAGESASARRLRRRHTSTRPQSGPRTSETHVDTRPDPPATTHDPGLVAWTPPPAMAPEEIPPPSQAPTPATRWQGADFGHPSLDAASASAELLLELDPLVAESPIGVAVILERRLQESPGKCPWILLRLLDLYRQMAQPWNHERVAAQLEALYNVRIPDMAPAGNPAGADLEAYPATMDRILQAWTEDNPAAALTDLLLHPSDNEALDQPAFEEALLLHGIVRQRQSAWLSAVDCRQGKPSSAPTPLPSGSGSRLMELLAA